MTEKYESPTTESLEKRGREVDESGVVKGKAWSAIVAGLCGVGALVIALVAYFL